MHENFFNGGNSGTLKGLLCHEISFYYVMKPKHTKELNSNSYTHGVKENMYWIPIGELDRHKVFPDFLKDNLDRINQGIYHVVTREKEFIELSK